MRAPTLVLVLTVLVGCDDGGGASRPPDPPANLDAAGSYGLSSRVDVPPTVLASQTIVDYLALLRQLRTDPAAAFFTLLDEAGVPMARNLRDVLPDAIEGKLTGAINDYVNGQASGGAGAEIDRILAFSESAFAHFTLASRLDVPAGVAVEPGPGTHVVQGLTLDLPGGIPVTVPASVIATLSPLPAALVASPTVSVTGSENKAGDATLAVGDHFFGLAYGELVFAALDGYGTGVSLRSRLGSAFDCSAMGNSVANRCVLGVCIGHAGDIAELCERGLDLAVAELHDQLAGMSFEAIRFASGRGELWDQSAAEPRDGVVDRIAGGVWQASIDISTGPRECKATFTGSR